MEQPGAGRFFKRANTGTFSSGMNIAIFQAAEKKFLPEGNKYQCLLPSPKKFYLQEGVSNGTG